MNTTPEFDSECEQCGRSVSERSAEIFDGQEDANGRAITVCPFCQECEEE